MKKQKKYVYFIAPIVGTIAFAAVYWNYVAGHDARIKAMEDHKRQLREAEVAKENADKKIAYEEAMKTKTAREKEKAEKAKHDQQEKDDAEAASQALDKARADAQHQANNLEHIKAEVKAAHEEIDKIKKTQEASLKEEQFLKDYVIKVQADAHKLDSVVEKIAAADDAAAKAAAAAAKAAKKES